MSVLNIEAQIDELRVRFDGLQTAHRKLLERVMDLELNKAYATGEKKQPPPKMDNLRPAYRRRSALIQEAQSILDAKKIPEKREVNKKGEVNV
jgi:hypothetical protein